MKFEELFEMPVLRPHDLPVDDHSVEKFISGRTVADAYDIVWKQGNTPGAFCLAIDKDRLFAVYGYFGVDPNRPGVAGINIVSIVDFKDGYDVGVPVDWDNNKVLQIDLVRTTSRSHRMGIGTDIYIKLAQAGFAIVSDTEQWNGGANLWKKIAASTTGTGVHVRVIDNGEDIGEYDGSNIPDNQLWSLDDTHKHMLFLLVKD